MLVQQPSVNELHFSEIGDEHVWPCNNVVDVNEELTALLAEDVDIDEDTVALTLSGIMSNIYFDTDIEWQDIYDAVVAAAKKFICPDDSARCRALTEVIAGL